MDPVFHVIVYTRRGLEDIEVCRPCYDVLALQINATLGPESRGATCRRCPEPCAVEEE